MSFTPGQRVFVVTNNGWASIPCQGYFATIDKVSPSGIVTIGEGTYRPNGIGRGNTYGRIREPKEGDEEIDAFYRKCRADAEIEEKHRRLAWTVAGVTGNQWVTLPREQLDIVAGILRGAGVLT